MNAFKFIFIIWILWSPIHGWSKDQNEIDSLLNIVQNEPNSIHSVEAYLELGCCGDFDQNGLEKYLKKALAIAQKNDSELLIADCMVTLADFYVTQGNTQIALEYYLESIQIFKRLDDVYGLGTVYNSMGLFYHDLGDYEKAINYNQQALELFSTLERKDEIGSIFNNLGNIYAEKEDYPEAIKYYDLSLDVYKEIGDTASLFAYYINMAIIQEELEDYVEAEKLYLLALEFVERDDTPYEDRMIFYTNLGVLKNKMGQQGEALNYFDSVLHFKNEQVLDQGLLMTIYVEMADIYKSRGQYKKAIYYFEEINRFQDSLLFADDLIKVQEVENKYELKLAEEKLEKENKLRTQLVWFGSVVAVLIIIILVFVVYSLRLKASRQKILVENKSKLLETELMNLRLLTEAQKKDLEIKKTSLTNFGLHIIWKKKLIDELRQNLQKLKTSDEKLNLKLKQINSEIRNIQGLGSDIEDFYVQAEALENDFVDKYQSGDLKLTRNEKKLIVLLKLGLSSKEISIINNVSEQAVKMSRHRLRSKLNVPKDITLIDFLNA
ncbi:tetratricopeptide repeat protein [bacterium SCSIO 12643]|nr:tetratricopeptide repeat protein [bacterium SCSIO 12643]